MGISEKVRSLHCGFQQGLGFEVIDNESILLLKNVPYELENIISKWIAVLPSQYMQGREPFVKIIAPNEIGLTQSGWSAFISWMTGTLDDAQYKSGYAGQVKAAAKKACE